MLFQLSPPNCNSSATARSGQVRSGQVRSDQVGSGQGRAEHGRTWQDKRNHMNSCTHNISRYSIVPTLPFQRLSPLHDVVASTESSPSDLPVCLRACVPFSCLLYARGNLTPVTRTVGPQRILILISKVHRQKRSNKRLGFQTCHVCFGRDRVVHLVDKSCAPEDQNHSNS